MNVTSAAPTESSPTRHTPWTDRLGGLASALCAVHCGVGALLPALLPTLGLGFLAGETTEWVLVAVAVGMAGLAAALGYRVHRSKGITLAFIAGMALLLTSRLTESLGGGHELGLAFALGGGAVLIGTHLTSLRRCRACREGGCAHTA